MGISNKSLHVWVKQFGERKQLDIETASANELAAQVRQLEKQLSVREAQIDFQYMTQARRFFKAHFDAALDLVLRTN